MSSYLIELLGCGNICTGDDGIVVLETIELVEAQLLFVILGDLGNIDLATVAGINAAEFRSSTYVWLFNT